MHFLIYGGSFDPVHHGHLILARAAREALNATAVYLIPAHVSPLKDNPSTSAQDRLEMLRLAVRNEPGFAIDDRELKRGGKSYTVDTLRELKAENPAARLTLLLGQDQLATFHAWHKVEEILEIAEVALMARPGHVLDEGLGILRAKLGSQIAQRLHGTMLATPLLEISATVIRERVRQGLPISYFVPDAVAAYIAARGLYR